MPTPIKTSLLCLSLALITATAADEETKKIPLDSIYTTFHQTKTKDAIKSLEDVAMPPFGSVIAAEKPAIFLVNGKDFPSAVKASRRFVKCSGDKKDPDVKSETRADEQSWVGAFLGINGSAPPAYRVAAIELGDKKIRIVYEIDDSVERSADYLPYLVWAPLGKLPTGEYTIELFDDTNKKIAATHKSKVTRE